MQRLLGQVAVLAFDPAAAAEAAEVRAQLEMEGILFVVVKVPVEGGISNHRIGAGTSLRIDPPRKAPATPAPALAQNTAKTPAAPKPAEAKPLSRLEQLRQEASAAKK